ncbi:N-acetylglucosamine-6-phosphate deacetylase [Candidatus Bipolaricaulota sp. J31]
MEILTNAAVYTPLEVIRPGTVCLEGGRIVRVFPGVAKEGEDLEGRIVAPGFVDLHIHGYRGRDTNAGTAEALISLARELPRFGVTAFVPTAVTAPHEGLLLICKAVAEAMAVQEENPEGARIIGLELEGPYINREKKGAQNPDFIREPSWDEFLEYWRASQGHIRTITVAPEVPGALEFIEKTVALGVKVSLGHTEATYGEARAAIAAGASRATHLFNAMPPLHHRHPGAVAACLESRGVYLELIADLVHVSAPMLRLTWRLAGPQRVVLITDSIPAAGLPNGDHSLGGLRVRVQDGVPRLEDGTLAGSTLTMDRAVRNAVSLGVSLQEALVMASYTPAKACGEGRMGLLRPGNRADLVVLDPEDLRVERVYIGGQRIFP